MMGSSLNEKLNLLDNIKNNISKNFLGSLSYIKMIDDLIKKLSDIEKETIKKSYDYEDSIDEIEIKIDEASRKGNSPLVKTLQRQRIRKSEELKSFMNNQRAKMKNGVNLIEKAVARKARRKEYAKLKLSDKDYEIAEFTYNYAKKKASDPKEVSELKTKYEKAREKVEKLVNSFSAKPEETSEIEVNEIDPKKERKYLESKEGEKVIERKSKLEEEILKMKDVLKSELDLIVDSIKSKPESSTNGFFKKKEKKLIELSNAIDSSKNLLDLYRSLGKNAKGVENKMKKESDFTSIINKINSTVSDGKDAGSGTTKYIIDLFNKLGKNSSESFVKEIIKKIS